MKTYFYRISIIDHLIQMECTGNAQQLAAQLGMARSTLFKYLDDMKELGAPIAYNRQRNTFYYRHKGSFTLPFNSPV